MSNTSNDTHLSIAKGPDIAGVWQRQGNIAYFLINAAKKERKEGITFYGNDKSEIFLSYQDILDQSVLRLGGLQSRNIGQGQYAILLLNDDIDFIITFWACILGGIIPAPLVYPSSFSASNAKLLKLKSAWEVLDKPVILSDKYLFDSCEKIQKTLGINDMTIINASGLGQDSGDGKISLAGPVTPAMIQFSSGSTNKSKGVVLTHYNLLTNVEGIIASAQITDKDKNLNWMPYFHDMGLIGMHLMPTAAGIGQIKMTPLMFIRRPVLWLEMISQCGITVTSSPNFGYRMVLERMNDEQCKGLDLRHLRIIFNGAEPISVSLMNKFLEKMTLYGMKKKAMYPVYGMAEASVAVSFPPVNTDPLVHIVDRQMLRYGKVVRHVAADSPNAQLLVDEGFPINGTEIRVVDEDRGVVPEGVLGEIQIRGVNVTSGYINDTEKTEALFDDGWLKTGDTGFMLNSRLTVAGRLKDIIFVNGQNFYAHDIEFWIDQLDGVKPGKVVVCGWHDDLEGCEKVGMFSALKIPKKDQTSFYSSLLKKVNQVAGLPIDFLIEIPSIPKTSSGKIQRFILVESFKNNHFTDQTTPTAELLGIKVPGSNAFPGDIGYMNSKQERLVTREETSEHGAEDIAVISMACRFPDASNPEEFWNNLVQGKCSIRNIPSSRWEHRRYYSPNPEFGQTYSNTAAFIDNVYDFDADLFNISEQEAAIMDPQQRLILELVYEMLERAGYSRKFASGKSIGVFIGASTSSYYEHHLRALNRIFLKDFDSFRALDTQQQEAILNEWQCKFGVTSVHPNILADNMLNMLAGRVAQEFNLKGPSIVLDAACSSSLIAIHLACESLRRNECAAAIVGGVNLLLTPTPFILFSKSGTTSKNGYLRAFDVDADGYVLGEGAGMVMLKPLARAIADYDEILAVVKASSINNSGRAIGVMAPNPDGQTEVIESLYRNHGISPESIQYIEASGVGTKMGDPNEIRSIDSAFKPWNLARQSIAIGSVKSNIGHLLSAAGIASFIKVVLMMNHKKMPPSINLTTPHPLFNIDRTPFYFLKETRDWNVDEVTKRRACLNTFAFGGTNCHMVVEEAPVLVPAERERDHVRSRQVLCLSAQTKTALEHKMNDLADCIEKNLKYPLADICYSENTRRTFLKCRYHIVTDSVENLIDRLRQGCPTVKSQGRPKAVLMFTGQCSKYDGTCRELYLRLPAFRKYVDKCSAAFAPYLNTNISGLIYDDRADNGYKAGENIIQPVIFTLDYALGSLLLEMGVKPKYMLGHGVGEWVSACLTGAVSLEDAARLVFGEGKLISGLKSHGAAVAVFTDKASLEPLLEPWRDSLWIAEYNISFQVVSGKAEELDSFVADLQKNCINTKKLSDLQPYHTPLMKPISDAFKVELSAATFAAPRIPFVSNLTGSIYEYPLTAEYWVQHTTGAIKFEQSIRYLLDQGVDIFVEVGPDNILTDMTAAISAEYGKTVLAMMDSRKDNWETLLNTLGEMFSLGLDLDWKAFEQDIFHQKIPLPVYPFEKKRFMPDFGGAYERRIQIDRTSK